MHRLATLLESIGRGIRLSLKSRPGLHAVLGNTAWLMGDRVVRMGMGVIVGVWVARYLGPDRFGILNFAISFVALFQTLTSLGLESMIVREIVREEAATLEILGTALVLRIGASVVATLLAIITIQIAQPHDAEARFLVAVLSAGLIFLPLDTIDSYFQSQVKSKFTVLAKNTAFLIMAGMRVLLIYIHAPLWWFALAFVSELALGAAGLMLTYRWTGGRIARWRASKRRAVELLSQSWPVILSVMAIIVYMRVDTIMLKIMQGDRAAGLYAAATRVTEVWYYVPMTIVSSVMPAIIRVKDNLPTYHARIQRLFSLMTITSLVLGSGIALGSKDIIHVLYSSAYDAAYPILAVHIWASVFAFLGLAQAAWDLSENLLKLSFYRTAAGAVINVLLNLVLIPRYSAVGAAIATVVSQAISGVGANAFSTKTRPILLMQLKSFLFKGLLPGR